MKNGLSLFLVVLFVGFGYSQTKLKAFKNSEISLKYPKTWQKFGAMGYVYIMPKIVKRNTFENEVEHVSVNKNVINYDGVQDVKEIISNYSNTLSRNEAEKKFKISKIEGNSKFIYKVEYLIRYNFTETVYKRLEVFFQNGNTLENYRYQMREDLFDKYYDDAMLIINSIEKR